MPSSSPTRNLTNKKVVISVSGRDKPGITSSLTALLDREGVELYDIEQSLTHDILSLSIVIGLHADHSHSDSVLKDLLFKAKELQIGLDFQVLENDLWVRSSQQQFAITLISNHLQPRHIAAISAVLAKRHINIDRIRKLNESGLSCLELIAYTHNTVELNDLKDDLLKIASRFAHLDIAVQRENLHRRSKRLVAFDMDSTLIQAEVIDELAREANAYEQVARITEHTMQGHIDFDESLRQRVALLHGLPQATLERVYQRIELTPGADVLTRALKKLGYKTALISGGFTYFAERFKERLGLNYAYSNQLEIVDGRLTGLVTGPIVNDTRKADLLELIAQQEGIPLESVIAIGDGANDIPMLKKAGLGIAFNAKVKARESASAAINQKTLASILYLLGITEKEVVAL